MQSQDGGQRNGKNIKNTPRNGMQPISGDPGGKFLYCFLVYCFLFCGANCAWPCSAPSHLPPNPPPPPTNSFWAFAWLLLAWFREKWKLCQEVNWLFRFKAFFNLYSVFVVNTNTFSFVSPTAATMPSISFPAPFRRFLHLLKAIQLKWHHVPQALVLDFLANSWCGSLANWTIRTLKVYRGKGDKFAQIVKHMVSGGIDFFDIS